MLGVQPRETYADAPRCIYVGYFDVVLACVWSRGSGNQGGQTSSQTQGACPASCVPVLLMLLFEVTLRVIRGQLALCTHILLSTRQGAVTCSGLGCCFSLLESPHLQAHHPSTWNAVLWQAPFAGCASSRASCRSLTITQ